MTYSARFPVLTPAWSQAGTVPYFSCMIEDIVAVYDIELPSGRVVTVNGGHVQTNAGIELVLKGAAERSPPLFGYPKDVMMWVRRVREGCCPLCNAKDHGPRSPLRACEAANGVVMPSVNPHAID